MIDKESVQMGVLSDCGQVSPVPGSDGPSPGLEPMWVTVHSPANKGTWQGGTWLWLRGHGPCELLPGARPLRFPDQLPLVGVEAGIPTSVQAIGKAPQQSLKVVQSSCAAPFWKHNNSSYIDWALSVLRALHIQSPSSLSLSLSASLISLIEEKMGL